MAMIRVKLTVVISVTFASFFAGISALPRNSRAIQPFYDKTTASKSSSFFQIPPDLVVAQISCCSLTFDQRRII
jgi:hypothetical protein